MPLPFPNIPAATDYISASQAQIQANFQALNGVVSGVYSNQAASPATAATELSVFNKVVGGNQVLCFGLANSGGVYPLSQGTGNFAFLPNGKLMKWGNLALTGPDLYATYDPTYLFTNTSCIQLTVTNNGTTTQTPPWAYANTNNANPFTTLRIASNATATATFNVKYLVIGNCNPIP